MDLWRKAENGIIIIIIIIIIFKTLSREGEAAAASQASESGESNRIEWEKAAGRRDQEEEIPEMSTPVTEEDLCVTTSKF